MKVKMFLLVLLVFVFIISNLFVFDVNASTTINKPVKYVVLSDGKITGIRTENAPSWTTYRCDTGHLYLTLTDLSNNTSYSYNEDLSGSFNLSLGNNMGDANKSIPSNSGFPTLTSGKKYLLTVDWYQVNNYYNVVVDIKGSYVFNVSTLSGIINLNDTNSRFNLVYNNDYNYTSNKASFTMQYTNFTFNYFTFLNTDVVSDGVYGGFHLLNYKISGNVIHCQFDNTFATMPNPHYLVYTVHGLDYFGNPIDLSGSISFSINVDTTPKVKNYKVSYVMDGSPCIAGSGGGRLYLYIDYGLGFVLQDVSKWTATISQVANGGEDTFNYGVHPNYNTAYKLAITKIDDIDTYNYDIYVNDTAKHLTGQLQVCSNDEYIFSSDGSQTSGEETDIFTLLKQLKDIIIGFWNLILSIVGFFGALLLAILNVVYSLGVAIISLLKIVFDFFASVSSIIFNRSTSYYSISSIVSIPNSFTYAGKVIALPGFVGQLDTVLKYLHDNIVMQYNGVWSLVALIILIKRHIVKNTEDEDDDE